jgi:hypothetical protein
MFETLRPGYGFSAFFFLRPETLMPSSFHHVLKRLFFYARDFHLDVVASWPTG